MTIVETGIRKDFMGHMIVLRIRRQNVARGRERQDETAKIDVRLSKAIGFANYP